LTCGPQNLVCGHGCSADLSAFEQRVAGLRTPACPPEKTSISKLVEGFFLTGRRHVQSGRPFSERWAGKVTLRTPEKADRRGTQLAKKYA